MNTAPPSLYARAALGDIASAVLIPLSKQGKLRVTYDWLYSALNCDPTDTSDFLWLFTKIDDTHIALSPKVQHSGCQLYLSVRDDWNWYAQVQAPFSADWITAIGRDETLTPEGDDLLVISLRGFNNQYLSVNDTISTGNGHSGFRLQSCEADAAISTKFFLGVTETYQDGLGLPLRSQVSPRQIRSALPPSTSDEIVDYVHRNLT